MKTSGLSRVSKDNIIHQIQKDLDGRALVLVTRHDTVSAASMDKLRAKLRKADSKYASVKKSLGKIALKKANFDKLGDLTDGSCGFVYGGKDPVAPSKVLMEFAKENQSFKIQGGIMNGQVLTAADIKALASLPSREVLIGKVLGGMQAPVSRFVGVLSNTLRGMVTVLDAIAKQKQA